LPAEVRLYDRLFVDPDPEADTGEGDFTTNLNPNSVDVLRESRVEPAVAQDTPGTRYQFERTGYFCSDAVDSAQDKLVFNRTVSLRDTWAKIAKKDTDSGMLEEEAEVKKAPQKAGPTKTPKHETARTPEFLAKLELYTTDLGLAAGDAEIIAANRILAILFDEACHAFDSPKAIANWVVNDLRGEAKGDLYADLPLTGAMLASLVRLVEEGTITRTVAKQVFGDMVKNGGDPVQIVREQGLEQLADSDTLGPLVDKVLTENEAKVAEYRDGRLGLLGFFVGQVMRDSGGKANPTLVKELVLKRLS